MGVLIKFPKNKLNNVEELKPYLEDVVDAIIEGKLIGFPTDSVYGIGGDPQNLDLINRLYEIKFRDREKGFLLLVVDLEEALKIAEFNEKAKILADIYWPGQLTIILKKVKTNLLPPEVTAFQETIGLRVPKNAIILTILKLLKARGKFGGIIGTSANFSGEPPSISGAEVAKTFFGPIDLIIEGGRTKSKIPTTIIDCTKEKIRFLRIGSIKDEEILNSLKKIY